MYNGETDGAKLKPPPQSFNIDLDFYKEACDWIKRFLRKSYGHEVDKVIHDAYPNIWRVYDHEGEVIVNINHDIMARLALVLEMHDMMIAEEEFSAAMIEDVHDKDEEDDGA